jgi:[ribosomal protein S18]-alanine N-acetyltransferase
MAVLASIRKFFVPPPLDLGPEEIIPALPTTYSIHPLTSDHLNELLRLNMRCFRKGDNYNKYTFVYLFNEPRSLSYRMVAENGELVAFAFIMANENGSAHITTLGVAPEHRRRGVAARLLDHIERSVRNRDIGTLVLEVRVGNIAAQELYRRFGFHVVQRVAKYYNNGEDCFLMMKAIF